jgi:hypothetical protein
MAMAGHELFAPTYTGLGERAHLASTENDLGSIAAAEARRGEISTRKVAAVRRAMAQARAADAVGDNRTCEKMLARVTRVLGP